MNRKSRLEDICFAAGVLLISWILLYFNARFRLNFKEQISIFLFGADRISWYLSNPALVASIAGDWLTQFFSSNFMAVTLSVLLLAVVEAGLVRFFRLAEPDRPVCLPLAMVPVLLEGYFVSFPNYPVSATVGLVLSVWSACALAHIKDSRFSYLIYGLSVPVVFVIAGGHAFTTALLLAFMKRKDDMASLVSITMGVVLMLICGRIYNLTILQTLIWPVVPNYIIPHQIWLLLMPWLILAVMILSLYYVKVIDSRWKSIALTLSMIICIPVSDSLANDELERTVKIGTLAYHEEWDEVREMASSLKSNFYRNYYWNLCNAREGRLADRLLEGGWGRSMDVLFLSTTRGDSYFSPMYYTDALLEMGDVSQATDCALLAQTAMPGHYSTRMLRKLAEIAVIATDYDVAAKYLNILLHTRNHREWAQQLLDCIESGNIPERYVRLRSKACSYDSFFVQGDIRSSLSIIVSESPYNRTAVDYLLCSYLLDKNLNTFIGLYDKYYLNALDRVVEVPDLYQEALLVNVNSDESLNETIRKYRISQKVLDKYMNLMEARAKDSNPSGVITSEARLTYWHYIMMVRFNNKDQE